MVGKKVTEPLSPISTEITHSHKGLAPVSVGLKGWGWRSRSSPWILNPPKIMSNLDANPAISPEIFSISNFKMYLLSWWTWWICRSSEIHFLVHLISHERKTVNRSWGQRSSVSPYPPYYHRYRIPPCFFLNPGPVACLVQVSRELSV